RLALLLLLPRVRVAQAVVQLLDVALVADQERGTDRDDGDRCNDCERTEDRTRECGTAVGGLAALGAAAADEAEDQGEQAEQEPADDGPEAEDAEDAENEGGGAEAVARRHLAGDRTVGPAVVVRRACRRRAGARGCGGRF